jgi:hypothetical protein
MRTGIVEDIQRWLDLHGGDDDLTNRLVTWALQHMDGVLEQALVEYAGEHGRYPRYGWVDLGLSDDFTSFTITAYVSETYPDSADVPAFTPIVDFSALVDNMGEA